MKSLFKPVLVMLVFVLSVFTAVAGEVKTVMLEVDGMTCRMCPYTVKKALRQVDGVLNVVAEYEGKGNGWAQVSYDVTKTNVDALRFATEEAGYPSRLKK